MSKKPTKQITQTKTTDNSKNIIFVFLGLLFFIFIFICLNNKFVQDDAFISFRYIRNFVEGNGLVFNIGERVEGYTNLLWVLLLSVFVFLKMNVENVAQILSVAFGIVTLYMTYLISTSFIITDD